MYILQLEIGESLPTKEKDNCCHPIRITTFVDDNPPDSCKDTLNIQTQTIQAIESFLACFDKTLRNEPFEQPGEVAEEIAVLLQAVGLTEDDIKHLLLTEKLAVGIGHLLLDKVLYDSVEFKTRYGSGRDHADGFRLRFNVNSQTLRKLPWEFLWDRELFAEDNSRYYEGFLAISRNKTISHSLSESKEAFCPQQLDRPLRMLFAVARPERRDEIGGKLPAIAGTKHLIQIQAALRGWCRVIDLENQHGDTPDTVDGARIEIHVADHISWPKLQKILEEHGRRPFDIFHYVGHAWLSGVESKGYCLALESEDDKRLAAEISATEIGELLTANGISLAILSGCETGQERDSAEGIAQTLVGHLARDMPFLYNGFAWPNWSAGAGTGATQSVPSLAATRPTYCSFATPLERRGVTIPAACCSLQPINDLSWRGRMLTIQGTPFQDALDRFGHIQPGTS